MSEIKAFIDNEGKAVIKCPECHAARVVDVQGYSKLKHFVRFKVQCPCKHSYRVILERREYFRKTVSLGGLCFFRNDMVKIEIKVHDISRKGIKIQLLADTPVEVGEVVKVEFRLDDEKKTLIRKDAVVRSIFGLFLGMEFFSIDPHNVYDKALGFYLM